MATKRETPLEQLKRRRGIKTTSPTTTSSDKLGNQAKNYRTRLQNIGVDAEEVTDNRNALEKFLNLEKDQNVLFDIFELLDRPRNALFSGIQSSQEGDSFWEGAKEGIKGNKEVSGKDLLMDNFDMEDEEGKLNLVDVLGFGLDVVGDPTNWALPGMKSLSDVAMDAGKKVIKGGAKAADKTLELGLKGIDKLSDSKIAKAAKRKGFDIVDDFLKATGISKGDTALGSYRSLKKGITDTFNQGKTKVGGLIRSKKAAQSSNDLLDDVYKQFKEPLEDLSYDYVLKNSANVAKYTDDLADLNKFRSAKKGNTVAKWIEKNPSKELAKVLSDEQSIVADDILDFLESQKSTKIKGKNVLRDLEKGYTFSGSEESVQKLEDILNRVSKEKGAKINFKSNKVSDLNKLELEDLNLRSQAEGISELEKKQLQDAIDAINRKNSTLTIEDIDMLDSIKSNKEIRQAFDDLDLNYNLEYNADEWNRLKDLQGNANFNNLVSNYNNTYKELANRIKATTGIDYSDITDMEGYLRRAKGDKGNYDEALSFLDDRIANAPDDSLKDIYQSAQNAVRENMIRGEGYTSNAFKNRKYRQPARVVNRQYQEAMQKEITNLNTKLDNLKQSFAVNKKESLQNTLDELKSLKNNSVKADKLNKRLIRYDNSIENISNKLDSTIEHANKVMGKIDKNIISKSLKIQDQAVNSNLIKQMSRADELNKQIKSLSKQLVKADNLDDIGLKNIQDGLAKANQELIDNNNALRKTVDIIDGRIDETIHKSLEQNAKHIDKYVDDTIKIDKYSAKIKQMEENAELTRSAVTELNSNLDQAIKRTNFALESIDEAGDAIIDNQIKELSKTISVLETEAGQKIFDLNFFGGMDDFINYAKNTNQKARVFQDAIATAAFNDESVLIKNLDNIDPDNLPKGFVKVSGGDLSSKLNDVQTMLGDNISKETIDTLKKELSSHRVMLMDERAASLFDLVKQTNKNKHTNAIMNLFDKTNNLFKKFSVLTPGFHLRNYTGNTLNSYLSGMPLSQIPVYQAKAAKVLNSMDSIKDKIAKGITLSADEESNWKLIKQFYDGGFAKAGTAVRDLEKLEQGLKVGSKLDFPGQLSMKANEAMDAMGRMSLLMYANDDLARGGKYLKRLGAEDPIQAVKYALMDPSNMSDFEVNTMKRLIPFYTFTKQNLMFQATNLGKNVGKYKRVMKAIEDMYADLDENAYYDYQKSNMQIPILGGTDDEGNQLFLKTNLPISDLGEFLSDPTGRLASSLTPIIKTPIEAKTGRDLFTGQDLNYKTLSGLTDKLGIDSGNARNTAELAELILKNFGLSNISTNLVKKVQAKLDYDSGDKSGQQLWAEIFRSVLQSTNEENVRQSGLYDELEAYQAEIKRLKNQGIDVPTIKEITASNKLKLNNLKNKRAKSK